MNVEMKEIAANGFRVSVRMLSHSLNCSEQEALERISNFFERDVLQFQSYLKSGIPHHLIERYIEFLKAHEVRFFKHQLKPTKKILEIDKWSKKDDR